jgi:HlyD family secretion protein
MLDQMESTQAAETETSAPAFAQPPTRMAWVVRAVVTVVVLVTGASIAHYLKTTKPKPVQSIDTARQVRLQVFTPQKIPVARQWVGQATTRPLTSANVPARVIAVVAEVADGIEAGQPVRTGQLLVRLESDDYQRQLEIAQRNVAEAEAQLSQLEIENRTLTNRRSLRAADVAILQNDLKRAEALKAKDATTRSEVDASRRSLINAQILLVQVDQSLQLIPPRTRRLQAMASRLKATESLAQLSVDWCRIVSPIDGVLQEVDVEVGESLTSGQRVARVVQLDRIEIPVQLPASASVELSVGASVLVQSATAHWAATVTRIAPEQDPASRTFTVFAVVDQSKAPSKAAGLMPGAYVRVLVTSAKTEDRWIVPRRAVAAGRLMVVRDGKVRSVPINVAYGRGGRFEQFGLPDRQWAVLSRETSLTGEPIVVNASRSLSDGQRVQMITVSRPEALR